jgi:aryl-alcohol dehydrogenase-like predicted oxidoreductase
MIPAVGTKLLLGTAQFGSPYGVSNVRGRVPPDEAERIVALAATMGVGAIDTAPAYGDAEATLGPILQAHPAISIVTKTARCEGNRVDGVIRAFDSSLLRLRRSKAEVLLVHAADDLLGPSADELWRALEGLRADARVDRLGVSVYTSAQAREIARRYPIGIVQLPWNVLDQRCLRDGTLAHLAEIGVEVHARSLLLQGLLLLHPDTLPAPVAHAACALRRFHAAAAAAGLSPLEAALRFAVGTAGPIARYVIGVTSRDELAEIGRILSAPVSEIDAAALAVDDAEIVDPSRWARPA